MYDDNRFEGDVNREDIFAESDVKIPEESDQHIYRKVEDDGSLASEPTPDFGRDVTQDPVWNQAKREAEKQAEWQGSTYRQSFVKKDEQPQNEQKTQQYTEDRRYSYRQSSSGNSSNRGQQKKSGGSGNNRKMNSFLKSVLCGVIIGVIAGGCVLGSFAIGQKMYKQPEVSAADVDVPTTGEKMNQAPAIEAPVSDASGANEGYTVADIAAQCQSSVVAITNKGVSEVYTFFGKMEQENEGSGSGVIVGKNEDELLIVTNNHVVDGAQELTVCFNDNENAVYEAQVKGTDPNNDLAVVAIPLSTISADDMNTISMATLGDSTTLKVGDPVVAIGNALGMGQSVTAGVISATSREVTIDNLTATLLQTDAAINPGNSGGALFNMQGELIGINSAKFASAAVEGMGFAIPISSAQPIMDDLMSRTTRTKAESSGYLNISGSDVSAEVSEMYGVPSGVYIAGVSDGGAAQKAGIQEGDILTQLDGIDITTLEQLKRELQYYEAGTTVDVVIQRNSGSGYEEIALQVTLDGELDTQALTQQPSAQEETQKPAEEPSEEEVFPQEQYDPFSQFFGW